MSNPNNVNPQDMINMDGGDPVINLDGDCQKCDHQKPCGIFSTILQAVVMSANKNEIAKQLGGAYVNSYARICEHYKEVVVPNDDN